MVHTQIGLFEAQLASIFKPHNSYCIFVDAKADKEFHKMVSNIIKCYKSKYPQVCYKKFIIVYLYNNSMCTKVYSPYNLGNYFQSPKIPQCILGP